MRSLLVCTLLLGCAAQGGAPPGTDPNDALPPEEIGFSEDAVIGGTVTRERPEVGTIRGCTASLVAPDVIITAAHCLGYGSRTTPGSYGQFEINLEDGSQRTFPITRYRSFSRTLGSEDICIMELGEPVPADVAVPLNLAEGEPPRGAELSIYGYGCTQRGRSTDWQKRRYDFAQGETTRQLCPGDSGGPVIWHDANAVYLINSGYYTGSGEDIYGNVARNHSTVRAQVEEWTEHDIGTPDPDPDPDPGPGPGPDPGPDPDPEPIPDPDPDPDPDPTPDPTPNPDDPCSSLGSCGACASTPGCGFCGSSGFCVSLDSTGNPIDGCEAGLAIDSPQCPYDSCGIYGDWPEYTCRRTSTSFVRCQADSTPEFLLCPSGYTCLPGSREQMCYRVTD